MEIPNNTFRYMTHVPRRRVVDKLHTSLGAAKNGINGTGGPGKIYELVDNEWVLLLDETGRPYSWQVDKIREKADKNQRRIATNRERAVREYIQKADTLAKTHREDIREAFVLGYVTALMEQWDARPEWSKLM